MTEYLTYLRRGKKIIDRAQAEIAVNVTAARILGDSWASIGEALGISKQAAQQRFGTVREKRELAGQVTLDDVHDES